MYASGATLLGQPGPQAGSTSGAAPGSAAGSAAGSSERISMLRLNSGFENFPNRWGIAELSRRQEFTENGAHTTTSSGSQRAVHMHLLRKGRSACLLLTRRSAQL